MSTLDVSTPSLGLKLKRVSSKKYQKRSTINKGFLESGIEENAAQENAAQSWPRTILKSSSPRVATEEVEESDIQEQIARMCLIALVTITNMKFDKTEIAEKEKLLDYVKQYLPVPEEKWKELLEAAEKDKINEWKLIVTVLKANKLTAKDRNGFSDPYVRMGIIRAESRSKNIVLRRNLANWDREGLVLSEILHTSVKERNLNPEWNEKVELHYDSSTEELLVLEVWDRDGKGAIDVGSGKITEFTFQGIRRFVNNAFVGDEFIGRAFIPLSDLSQTGAEHNVTLTSHSENHSHGKLHLLLHRESVQRQLSDNNDPLYGHTLLLYGLVDADSRDMDNHHKKNWDGLLSPNAEALLQGHSSLISITDLQQSAIKLNAFLYYERKYGLDIKTFLGLLVVIRQQCELSTKVKSPATDRSRHESTDTEDYTSNDEKKPILEKWESKFHNDLMELMDIIVRVLQSHITRFQLSTPSGSGEGEGETNKQYQDLSVYIKLVEELDHIPLFTEYLAQKCKGLTVTDLVAEAVPMAAADWFNDVVVTPSHTSTLAEIAKNLNDLCSSVWYMCDTVLRNIAPLFKKGGFNIDYFSHFYQSIEILLADEVIVRLNEFQDRLDSKVSPDFHTVLNIYSTYLHVRKILATAQPHVDQKVVDPANALLPKYHDWYKPLVPLFIRSASDHCKESISNDIEQEESVPLNAAVKYSSSVRDASDILIKLFNIRDDLEWPVTGEMLEFTRLVMKEVTDGALFYVNHSAKIMKDTYIYDAQKHFRATEELGILLNNLHEMSQVFDHWPKIIPPLSEEETKEKINAKLIQEIEQVMASFHRNVALEISKIIKRIVEKILPDIRQELENLLNDNSIRLPQTYDNLNNNIGPIPILPLVNYLSTNLRTLSEYLFAEVFDFVLKDVWHVSMEVIRLLISSITADRRPNRVQLHEKLFYSLQMLKHFCNAEGTGIPYPELEDDSIYQELVVDLNILRTSDNELILKFLSSVGRTALTSDKGPAGTIYSTVVYIRKTKIVKVELVGANNLKSTSTFSKFSACFLSFNPMVELSLAPQCLFPNASERTKIIKNNMNPEYNQTFEFSAPEEVLSKEGASLLLSVYNIGCGRHYVGMGRVPLNKIKVQDTAQSGSTGEASKQPDSDTADTTPPGYDATPPRDDVTATREDQVVALYIWQPDGSDKVFKELKERHRTKTNKSVMQFFKRYADNFN